MLSKQARYSRRRLRNSYNIKYLNMQNRKLPCAIVYKSNQHIGVQIVDIHGNTLTYASSNSKEFKEMSLKNIECKSYNIIGAKAVGEIASNKCKKLNINDVIYDRNGNLCHGRVKAVFQEIQNNLRSKNNE